MEKQRQAATAAANGFDSQGTAAVVGVDLTGMLAAAAGGGDAPATALRAADKAEAYRLTAAQAAKLLQQRQSWTPFRAGLEGPEYDGHRDLLLGTPEVQAWQANATIAERLLPALELVVASGCTEPYNWQILREAEETLANADDADAFFAAVRRLIATGISQHGQVAFGRLTAFPAEGEAVTPEHYETVAVDIKNLGVVPVKPGLRRLAGTADGERITGVSSARKQSPRISLPMTDDQKLWLELYAKADGVSDKAWVAEHGLPKSAPTSAVLAAAGVQ